ncbi:MAG: transporter substrate-binding domain-containing protein [Cyanobacteria bacterium]|nr:transporter substrate-binding domain-containing protein [Cyanobacteria bacterium CG_2015-16_32_12]NCO76720.1 transporter substrate-binding domain-containing protein [Cyanobacteria bacterium CG_2015-22_32_23]NCQ03874.1 transporter substrate-binding domain-containing protein [Cyanobacteria bacterium CG_2015-09_32_10]NCQ40953.1 transporter substrate-binding domain-containing protein [Cyanobacteria bacterium CG_2015-04_32_10]
MIKHFRHGWIKPIALGLLACISIIFMTFNPFTVEPAKSQLIAFKVGTEPTFPPFEMPSEDGSGLQGFDIDLMKAIGNEVNLAVEFESLPFDGLIPALQSNTIDAAVSGITITAERGLLTVNKKLLKSS